MINQNDNQDGNQNEKQIEKNVSCNVFFEQLELLNQLPEKERGNVIYLALLKAFSRSNYQLDNQDDTQLENQLENTYISISKSISLSRLSITVLNLLNKTLDCKIYSKNWGGKRQGSGKPPKEKTPKKSTTKIPTRKEIEDYCNQISKKIDIDEFIAYYDASNWEDEFGTPVIWKRKVLTFAKNYKPKETTPQRTKKTQEEITKLRIDLLKKGMQEWEADDYIKQVGQWKESEVR